MILLLKIIGAILIVNLIFVALYCFSIPKEMRKGYWYFHADNVFIICLLGSLAVALVLFGLTRRFFPAKGEGKKGYLQRMRLLIFGKQNSEYFDLIKSDLEGDARDLKKNGRSPFYIAAFVFIHSVWAIIPILFDGLLRLAAKLLPFGKIFKS